MQQYQMVKHAATQTEKHRYTLIEQSAHLVLLILVFTSNSYTAT